MTMIKKTLLVTCMLTSTSAFASDHEFLTTNPYGVDVPHQPQVIIGVEKPRVDVDIKTNIRSGVRVPTELQTPTELAPLPKAEVDVPLDRSSFYEDEELNSQSSSDLELNDDSDLFNSSNSYSDEPINTNSATSATSLISGVSDNSSSLPPVFVSSDEIVSVVDQPQVNS